MYKIDICDIYIYIYTFIPNIKEHSCEKFNILISDHRSLVYSISGQVIQRSMLHAFSQFEFHLVNSLWSSGHSSWLQIQRPGFDSRRYQIF
jgi:hypothetical protein